ncbi:MAG TPA: M23 family metallopeptidase [Agromyces sp.]|nr:M23 family metallopeptidase [Agromyces sp.]
MPHSLEHPVIVDFPLRGSDWMAVQTPAARVPSHGSNLLGTRYAYDFLKVDRRGYFHPMGAARGLLVGGPTRDAYAWGASIHAPFDGVVVGASDGMTERPWIHPVREAARMVWTAATFEASRIPSILGNYVLLRSDAGDIFAGFAHLAPGTLAVAEGQRVTTGDVLGRVGHTGNSTSPHLHFQLMDSADLMSANGIPCAFRAYLVERHGERMPVRNGIPGRRDRIASVDARDAGAEAP